MDNALERLLRVIQEQHAENLALVQDWQREAIQPGVWFITRPAPILYHQALQAPEGARVRVQSYGWFDPEGAQGYVGLYEVRGPLTEAQIDKARALGWPGTAPGFRQVVQGDPAWDTGGAWPMWHPS